MSPLKNKAKETFKQNLIFIGMLVVIVFVVALHMPFVTGNGLAKLSAALAHLQEHPFEMQFVTENMKIVAVIAVIGFGYACMKYNNEKDLRPGIESGSAKWNTNIGAYNRKYTYPKKSSKTDNSSYGWNINITGSEAQYKAFLNRNFSKKNESGYESDIVVIDENKDDENLNADKMLSLYDIPPMVSVNFKKDDGKKFNVKYESKNKNFIFTDNVYFSMLGRDTMRNCNILVAGGSGAGKSRFMVKPNMLQANCSYVVTDPSGELLETLGTFLKEQCGYQIKVLNLVQMDMSSRYNPFHYIRNEEGVLSMINALIANTTPPGSNKGDPFWEKSETALLLAICFYLYFECEEEDRNFSSVMKMLRMAEIKDGQDDAKSPLDIVFDDLAEKNPEHIAVRQYKVFKSAGSGKTAQSILICAMTRLNVFDMSALSRLTEVDDLHLEDIGDRPTALFCITPVADTTFNFIVALLYTQLFETLYFHAETACKGKRLPVHVRFMLDEFANIGQIPQFSEKLATMRKYEISCTIILQTISQLKKMYKDDHETIIGNCDSFLFLGGQEQSTLELVSKKLGKETIRVRNSSRNVGGRNSGGSMSYNTTARELMMPDEIAKMDTSNCIYFLRGENPFFGNKFDYPKHSNYKYTGDAENEYLYNLSQHRRNEDNEKDFDGDYDENDYESNNSDEFFGEIKEMKRLEERQEAQRNKKPYPYSGKDIHNLQDISKCQVLSVDVADDCLPSEWE